MTATLEIPVWLALLLGVLAAVALLDRLLVPSARWYLRRRFNRAVERLNDRLQLRIQPFKLTRRRVMIDRLVHDPEVMDAVAEHALAEDMPPEMAVAKARKYAQEIVPSFSAFAYFGFAIRVSRFLSQALYRVRIAFSDDDALREVDPRAAVVFVMNHRSNMDYVLVTWLAAERSALAYAVGEWARVWPLQQLIRSLGAYFIRRRSRNTLYRRVLARYVQMATEGGVTQAMFPEGGLSLDGRPRPVRLGLLSYMLAGFDARGKRDVVFIPVAINYDRVLEDRVLVAARETEGRFNFRLGVFLGFAARQIWLRMTRRFFRYGYACVSFGRPVSLRAFLESRPQEERPDEDTRAACEALGAHLMARVCDVVPVLPVPLVATIFADADVPLSRLELKARGAALLSRLRARGAIVHLPRDDADYALEVGLRILLLRRAVSESEGRFSIAGGERDLIGYYANSIAHLTAPEAP